MISIFNGRKRSLGKGKRESYYLQMDVQFRQHLHILKGPKLAIFLCLSLHSDKDGWSFPKISTIAKETGYKRDAISASLTEMEKIEIKGKRLLLKYQPRDDEGQFQANRYLLFPSKEEVEEHETRFKPCRSEPDTAGADTDGNRVGRGPIHEEEPLEHEEEPLGEEEPIRRKPAPVGASVSSDSSQSNGPSQKQEPLSSSVKEIFIYWQSVMGRANSQLTPERQDKIASRLKQKYTVEQIKRAIDGCRASSFNMGDNSQHRAYNDLTLICRSGSKLEEFIALTAPPVNGNKSALPPGSRFKNPDGREMVVGYDGSVRPLASI